MSCTHPNYTHEAPSQDRVQTQPLCWGEPTRSWISPNSSAEEKTKTKTPPPKQTSIIAVICPVYSSSPSHIHLCFPPLPSVKPVWHLPAASSALRLIRSYLAHKRRASSRKRSYCKYDNSIRCCNQLCQWVTRARTHPQKYLRSGFGVKVGNGSQFQSWYFCTFVRFSCWFQKTLSVILIESPVEQQHQETRWITLLALFIYFNLTLFLTQINDAIFWFACLAIGFRLCLFWINW